MHLLLLLPHSFPFPFFSTWLTVAGEKPRSTALGCARGKGAPHGQGGLEAISPEPLCWPGVTEDQFLSPFSRTSFQNSLWGAGETPGVSSPSAHRPHHQAWYAQLPDCQRGRGWVGRAHGLFPVGSREALQAHVSARPPPTPLSGCPLASTSSKEKAAISCFPQAGFWGRQADTQIHLVLVGTLLTFRARSTGCVELRKWVASSCGHGFPP